MEGRPCGHWVLSAILPKAPPPGRPLVREYRLGIGRSRRTPTGYNVKASPEQSDKPDPSQDRRSIAKRLAAVVWPYRGRALLSLLAMAGTAATQPMLGKALELLLDRGFGAHRHPFSLWLVPAVLLFIFVLRGICTFATAYFNNWVMSRMLNDLRGMVFERVLRLPVARFANESTGKIINTVIGDVRQVVDMINSVFLAFVRDSMVVAGLLIALLLLNWQLTLVALVVVPLTAVIVRTTTGRLRRLNRDNQRVTIEM